MTTFRDTVKSAKWTFGCFYRWKVGPRSGKRLDQWVSAVSEAAQALLEQESAELKEGELGRIKAEAAKVISEVNRLGTATDRINAAVSEMEQAKTELDNAKLEREKKQSEADEAAKNITGLFEKACDFPAIKEAHQVMIKTHLANGSRPRNAFHEAQAVIKEQSLILEDLGFESKGLTELRYASFNRPDRDNAYRVSNEQILDIAKIES